MSDEKYTEGERPVNQEQAATEGERPFRREPGAEGERPFRRDHGTDVREGRDGDDRMGRGGRGGKPFFKKKVCRFCVQKLKADYKDADTLQIGRAHV